MKKFFFPLITEEESRLPFYLKGIGVQEEQEYIERPEGHSDYHWIHSTKGKGILLMNGKEYTISENMGFFLYPGIPHEYYSVEEPWETHWIIFDGVSVKELLSHVQLPASMVFYLENSHLMEESFQEVMRSASRPNTFNGFQTSVHLYQFLILCRSCITGNNKSVFLKQKQLEPVVAFLEQNYYRNPSLEEMAAVINVTPHHLCRLFKEVFKIRPFVYLTKIRLKKAKEIMFEEEELPVKYVAKKVGYNDLSYFCSIFKEYEGVTPTEFKSIHRK